MPKFADRVDLKPMKLSMQDLRCDVYVVFSSKQCRPQTMYNKLMKLGLSKDKKQFNQFKKYAVECKDNPGYTLSLSNLECIIVINQHNFSTLTISELIGTLVHEMSHAVTMLFDDLGCEDDELRSIELENILVQALHILHLDELTS